jgi:DNA-binding response OmpR family regulator
MLEKKILIVDDEEEAAFLLKDLLLSEGFTSIDHAPDAVQAGRKVRSFSPDLILLDIQMPGGGGVEVFRRLRQSASSSHIPVIVITGVKDDEIKRRFSDEGIHSYFQKPYKPEMLMAEIKSVLERKSVFAGARD